MKRALLSLATVLAINTINAAGFISTSYDNTGASQLGGFSVGDSLSSTGKIVGDRVLSVGYRMDGAEQKALLAMHTMDGSLASEFNNGAMFISSPGAKENKASAATVTEKGVFVVGTFRNADNKLHIWYDHLDSSTTTVNGFTANSISSPLIDTVADVVDTFSFGDKFGIVATISKAHATNCKEQGVCKGFIVITVDQTGLAMTPVESFINGRNISFISLELDQGGVPVYGKEIYESSTSSRTPFISTFQTSNGNVIAPNDEYHGSTFYGGESTVSVQGLTDQRFAVLLSKGLDGTRYTLATGARNVSYNYESYKGLTGIEESEQLQSLTVQPDGKLLVAGLRPKNNGVMSVLRRYSHAGEVDLCFGDNGVLSFSSTETMPSAAQIRDVKVNLNGTAEILATHNTDARLFHAIVNDAGDNGSPDPFQTDQPTVTGWCAQRAANATGSSHTFTQTRVWDIPSNSPITITNGQYRINDGSWTSSSGVISSGDTIQIQVNAGSSGGTVTATVSVNGIAHQFTATFSATTTPGTGGGGTTPPPAESGGGGGGSTPIALLFIGLFALTTRCKQSLSR